MSCQIAFRITLHQHVKRLSTHLVSIKMLLKCYWSVVQRVLIKALIWHPFQSYLYYQEWVNGRTNKFPNKNDKTTWKTMVVPNCSRLIFVALKPEYFGQTRSIPWMLMPWLFALPGHQQPRYWFRINGSLFSPSKDISATFTISESGNYRESLFMYINQIDFVKG